MKKSKLSIWLVILCLVGHLTFSQSPGQLLKSREISTKPEIVKTELFIKDCNDGDTCTAKNRDGLTLKLRLLGVDAPETAKNRGPKKNRHSGQAFGNEAKEYLNSRVKGKWLQTEIRGSDVFQRFLALIFYSQENQPQELINQTLVTEGYAFAYRGPAKTDSDISKWAEAAENAARKNKKGLWGLKNPPESPDDFRRKNRN